MIEHRGIIRFIGVGEGKQGGTCPPLGSYPGKSGTYPGKFEEYSGKPENEALFCIRDHTNPMRKGEIGRSH